MCQSATLELNAWLSVDLTATLPGEEMQDDELREHFADVLERVAKELRRDSDAPRPPVKVQTQPLSDAEEFGNQLRRKLGRL